MPGGLLGQNASNLKPIQPRPTILPEPTPNLSLDELRRSKKDLKNKHKKDTTSPGNSPPRISSQGGGSLSTNQGGMLPQSLPHLQSHPTNLTSGSNKSGGLPDGGTAETPAKSPAYSDIS